MHAQSWRDTYPNEEAGISKEWVNEWTAQWVTPESIEASKEYLKEALTSPLHLHRLAVVDGEVVGLLHASKDEDKQSLDALYLDKAYHGNGLADTLMRLALEWLDPTLPISLEVATYNARAIAFYNRYGFGIQEGSEHMFRDKIPVITMQREGVKS
jgi:ribosomal protein S18 acetylase RimI-like enzyme